MFKLSLAHLNERAPSTIGPVYFSYETMTRLCLISFTNKLKLVLGTICSVAYDISNPIEGQLIMLNHRQMIWECLYSYQYNIVECVSLNSLRYKSVNRDTLILPVPFSISNNVSIYF